MNTKVITWMSYLAAASLTTFKHFILFKIYNYHYEQQQ